MKLNKIHHLLLAVFLIFAVSGCVTKNSTKPEKQVSARQLYANASREFKDRRYKRAASIFADITYQFPYYKWASRARIMEVYSHYLAREYDSAVDAADEFINIHPASKEAPYAYYMKALCYYEQIDIPYRDQGVTIEARQAFTALVRKFPKSIYARDAKIKLELIEDHLAAQEMIVGRYYVHSGNILAAIKRFKAVVDNYSTTSQIEEALYRLVESYVFLGMKEEAKRHAAVLYHNYPNSQWYKDSYALIQNMSVTSR